ncbi:MAG: hypothetical protein ACLPHI_22760 [Terriglobales bacterium]|jgi:hypothetical protein
MRTRIRFAFATTLAWGLLAVAWPAEAQIVYTRTNITIGHNSSYNLDLNNDGVTDFIISTNSSRTRGCDGYLGVWVFSGTLAETPVSGNGAAGSPPTNLAKGDQIGPSQTFYEGTGTMAWFSSCSPPGVPGGPYYDGIGGDNWMGYKSCGEYCLMPIGLKGYLGLTFQIDGETHYGWVLVSVSNRVEGARLLGYAYETTTNMPINAGQTK